MALKANKKSVLSPYRLSRLVKGLTQNEASVLVGASPRSLIRYENEENEPPKGTVMLMDKVYGCGGRLINYWLTGEKFSFRKLVKKNKLVVFIKKFKGVVKMSKLTHLGTCRIMKASTLGAILKLTKKSRYSGTALCVNRPKGGN